MNQRERRLLVLLAVVFVVRGASDSAALRGWTDRLTRVRTLRQEISDLRLDVRQARQAG